MVDIDLTQHNDISIDNAYNSSAPHCTPHPTRSLPLPDFLFSSLTEVGRKVLQQRFVRALFSYVPSLPRWALSITNCTIGETVCYLAKINEISLPNWRNIISVIIIDVISNTCPALLKLSKLSHIQLTQITSQCNVTCWVNNRSLIPPFSRAHRQ